MWLYGVLITWGISLVVLAVLCITAERYCQCRVISGKCRSFITGDDMLCDRCRVGACAALHAIELRLVVLRKEKAPLVWFSRRGLFVL